MSKNYIPRPDADFATWVENFVPAVVEFYIAESLDPSALNPLKDARSTWSTAYPEHIAAQAVAESARSAKDAARIELEKQIRPVTNFVQAFAKTTDSARAVLGITIKQQGGGISPPPNSRPVAQIEAGTRLTHTLRISDESTPTRKARPRNTVGAEVRATLIAPGEAIPSDPNALRYMMIATNGAATATFPPDAGGKTAVYMFRWISKRGGNGPWSDVAVATIAA